MTYNPNAEPIIPVDIDTSELDVAGLVPMEGQDGGETSLQTSEFIVDPNYEAGIIAGVREASALLDVDGHELDSEGVRTDTEPAAPIDLFTLASEKFATQKEPFNELREKLAPLAREHKGLLAEKRALLDKPRPRSPEDTARLEEITARVAEVSHLREGVREQMTSLNENYDRLFDENNEDFQEREAEKQEWDRRLEKMDQIKTEIKKLHEAYKALYQEFLELDAERRAIIARQPDPKLWSPIEIERVKYIGIRAEEISANGREIDDNIKALHNAFMET